MADLPPAADTADVADPSIEEAMAREAERRKTIDALRWEKLPVLDDGFVCLVDVMGSDQAVVQAARVSYGDGTRRVSDDRTLIRYLMRHDHATPFEMAEVKMLIRMPMDAWRQQIRHRAASVNEYSTRYSLAIDARQTTLPDEWRLQAQSNRQGSDGDLGSDLGQQLTDAESAFHKSAQDLYEQRIELGVAREQARKDLPLCTYTEAYWKCDLRNLLHYLALRMDLHAQKEIRDYARTIGEQIVAPLFPLCWEAFTDYRLESMELTRLDRGVITRLMEHAAEAGETPPFSENEFLSAQDETWRDLKRCRERDECRSKLVAMGIVGS